MAKPTALFLALAALMVSVGAQDTIGCFEPGICKGGAMIDVSQQEDGMSCLDKCKSTLGCQYFSYYETDKACFTFMTCPDGLDFSSCGTDCRSGDVSCEKYTCDVMGLCLGHVIRFEQVEENNHAQCKANCYAHPECTWYGYYTDTTDCMLLSECITIQESYQFVRTGQKACYDLEEKKDYSKLFVAGGCTTSDCTSEAELLDISDGFSTLTCPQPDPFPYPVSFATALNANDYPMVCGGFGRGKDAQASDPDVTLAECHRFHDGMWDYVGDMNEKRQGASGLQLGDGTVWITGGQSSPNEGDFTASTETINLQGNSTPYIGLPKPLAHHCIVQMSEFVFGLIGGADMQMHASREFWMFDSRTEEWTKGDDMNNIRYGHVCQYVFSETRGAELIVAGGTATGNSALASTEILSLTTMHWRNGADLPEPLLFAASTRKGDTMVTVGGNDAELDSEVGTYHYDMELQIWVDSPEERLSSKRYGVAAVAVDTGLAGCV